MNLKSYFYLPLLLCVLGWASSLSAQPYNITHDLQFSAPLNCPNDVFNNQDGNWTGAEITLETTHNIFGIPSSPNFNQTVNNAGYFRIYWDIYDVDGQGNETLEGTVASSYYPILAGAVGSGSDTRDFELDITDLSDAGIEPGVKVVRVRFYMGLDDLVFTINGDIQANGASRCTETPLDGNSVTCNIGVVDCFEYSECAGGLSVSTNLAFFPIFDTNGNIVDYEYLYSSTATMVGGSGNYTYNWGNESGGVPQTGTGSTYVFLASTPFAIYGVTVTDNVTGCNYYYSSLKSRKQLADAWEMDLQVFPNPVSPARPVSLHFQVTAADLWAVQVTDLNGRKLWEQAPQRAAFSGEQQLEIPYVLAPGIYFVSLFSAQQGTIMKKLVVQ